MKKNTKIISGIAGLIFVVIILGYLGKDKIKEGLSLAVEPAPMLPSGAIFPELLDLALIHHGNLHSSRNNVNERELLLHAEEDLDKAFHYRDEANQAAVAALKQVIWENRTLRMEEAVVGTMEKSEIIGYINSLDRGENGKILGVFEQQELDQAVMNMSLDKATVLVKIINSGMIPSDKMSEFMRMLIVE